MNNVTDWESRLVLHDLQPNDHDFFTPEHVAQFLRNHKTGIDNRGRQQLVHIIKSYNDPTILDVACGTAVNYEVLRNMGVKCLYTGYDRTQQLLDHAKSLYGENILLKRGHAQDLPYADRTFDVSILRHILEHMSPENAYRAIEEAIRVSIQETILVFFLTPHNGPTHNIERRPSNIEGHPEITHYWNTYSWLQLMQFLSKFGRKISREDVYTFGAAAPDCIVRLRV